MLDLPAPEAGAIYIMDRGYLDFERLYVLHRAGAFFVTRSKANLDARRIYSALTVVAPEFICDHTIALNGFYSRQHYPDHLRRIRFKDSETGKTLLFLTNQFDFPAAPSARFIKERWQVEIFFKWIQAASAHQRFFVLRRTRENPKSGSPSPPTCSWPSSKNASSNRLCFTLVTDPFRHPLEKRPSRSVFCIACISTCTANVNQLNLFEF